MREVIDQGIKNDGGDNKMIKQLMYGQSLVRSGRVTRVATSARLAGIDAAGPI